MNNPAHEVLTQWLDLVNAGNVEGVLGLYDDQAVLLPTFQGKILDTPELRRAYFEKLGGYDTLGVEIVDGTLSVQKASEDVHVLGGHYDWQWSSGGTETRRQARFSYVVNLSSSKPILHHHSSELPLD